MSDDEEQFKAYQKDTRIPCRYGAKCYQKSAVHHDKYKHPPSKDAKKQRGVKRTITSKKRKKKETNEASPDSLKKKVQKKDDNATDQSIPQVDDIKNTEENKYRNDIIINESNSDNEECVKDSVTKVTIISLLKDCNIIIENDEVLPTDIQMIISHLFLMEMPTDFFELYEFCKNISEKDPLHAFKDIQLQLVGPYDVFRKTFLNSKVYNKKSLLRHWRYYYDPPEFQTVIKGNTKEGLHFGYWRDDPFEKPVFVAKNKASIDCVIEPIAENIFGTLHVYIGEKLKTANPFEKVRIAQLQQKLKDYAKQKNIILDKKTSNMQTREKKVVTRTFHKAGIVVPYNKKTELGYRDLVVTDSELRKILKEIEEACTLEGKKAPFSKLEEVIRLATIAADECDFGTCLELGHDLFCSGVSSVQNKALHMLSLAYNLLKRPQFLEIAQAHLEHRRKDQNLNVLS